jgi:predicted nucleotidyltransferase
MPGGELPAFLQVPVARLVLAFAPGRIVLFGSHAAGSAAPGSDVDLLVIADVAGEPEIPRRRARQLVADSFPPIDIVFCTPEEADNAERARSPFLQSILENGVTLYERSQTRR